MGSIQQEGFDFWFNPAACRDCPGYCCCGESGKVWVHHVEMNMISAFLQIHLVDFIERYLDRSGNRFSCKERMTEQGLECVFFQGAEKKCSIYSVRPEGCRTYPFWDHFKADASQVVKECPGVQVLRKISE